MTTVFDAYIALYFFASLKGICPFAWRLANIRKLAAPKKLQGKWPAGGPWARYEPSMLED